MTIWSRLGIAWKGDFCRGKVSALAEDDHRPKPPTPRGKKGHFRPVQWAIRSSGTSNAITKCLLPLVTFESSPLPNLRLTP